MAFVFMQWANAWALNELLADLRPNEMVTGIDPNVTNDMEVVRLLDPRKWANMRRTGRYRNGGARVTTNDSHLVVLNDPLHRPANKSQHGHKKNSTAENAQLSSSAPSPLR